MGYTPITEQKLNELIAQFHEPQYFIPFCNKYEPFLNSEIDQFTKLVPAERVKDVSRIYCALKLYAPKYLEGLRPFCTALGLLDDEFFQPLLYRTLSLQTAGVHKQKKQVQKESNILCLEILIALYNQARQTIRVASTNDFAEFMAQYKPSADDLLWLERFSVAYIIIGHFADQTLWGTSARLNTTDSPSFSFLFGNLAITYFYFIRPREEAASKK